MLPLYVQPRPFTQELTETKRFHSSYVNGPEVAGSQPAGSRAYSSFYLSSAPASLNRSLKEVYKATDLIQNGCFDVQQKQALYAQNW